MEWYIVKLVFQIIREGQHASNEFDVQLRLILADEKEWALEKAATIGRLEETTFKNSKGQLITWRFIGVTEINLLGELEDALLVHSESEEPGNMAEYKRSLRAKMDHVYNQMENVRIRL